MLTSFIAGGFDGDVGSEPALIVGCELAPPRPVRTCWPPWCLGGGVGDPFGSFNVLVLPIVGCKLAEVDDDCINWQWLARR